MRLFFLNYFIFFYLSSNAQQLSIKGGIIGIPFFEGFPGYIISGGAEWQTKNKKNSWQLIYNYAEGAVAQDAPQYKRNWFSLDKIHYVPTKTKVQFLYSFFLEAGRKIKYPGYGRSVSDTIFNNKNSFEINPGLSAGAALHFSKNIGMQFLVGPKLIIANSKTNWYNITTRNYFYTREKEYDKGYRFNVFFNYNFNFSKKK